MEVADLEVSTREAHEGYICRTIGPVLGEVKIRKLGADSLCMALKKCSRLCRGCRGRALRRRRAYMRWAMRAAARPPHHPPARL